MGARGKKASGKPPASGGKGGRKSEPLSEDMYDEVDAFHLAKDKISLAPDDDDQSDESDEEEGVMDMEDSEEEGEEGSEDESDLDEDIRKGGMIGQMAKDMKEIKRNMQKDAKEDEDDEDDDDEEDDKRWGRRKREYYDAENVDYEIDSDEDAPVEEEKEAMRLQREQASKLRADDYEQSDDDDDEDEDEDEEETMEAAASSKGKKGKGRGGAEVEVVEKDKSALSREAQLAALTSDAPELLALLAELQGGLGEVRDKVQPLLEKVRDGDLATQEGVSYLEAKHLLMLSYCTNIVFYLMLKSEGRSVRDHPVVSRLVQIRSYIEKIRPIDKKLQYQIDKLLAAADAPAPVPHGAKAGTFASETMGEEEAGGADPLSFGPNPTRLLAGEGEEGGGGDGVYKAPKITPAAMGGVGEEAEARGDRGARRAKDRARKAASSSLLKELNAEAMGLPQELRDSDVVVGGLSEKEKKRREMRDGVEEDMFMRVPLSKDEKKRRKREERAGLQTRLDDFGDDIHDVIEGVSGMDGEARRGPRLGDSLGLDGGLGNKNKRARGGDEDLPVRDSLGDRRAKYQPPQVLQYDMEGNMMEGGLGDDTYEAMGAPLEDATYKAAREKGEAKKRAHKERNAKRPTTHVPQADDEVEGEGRARKRDIGVDIEKNRGLTPHRNKADKNPRKKHRNRFEAAKVRRKGAVREVADGAAGGYSGEATGIKSRVTKSTRL